MTSKRVESLIRRFVLPSMKDSGVSGRLLFRRPLDWLLNGYFFDGGSNPDKLRVRVFMQSLYIPRDTFVFNMGFELGWATARVQKWWHFDPGNESPVMADIHGWMTREGEPFLERYGSVRCLGSSMPIRVHPDETYFGAGANDVHVLEARAYSSVIATSPSVAAARLDELLGTLRDTPSRPPWYATMESRVALVRSALLGSGEEALSLLMRWRRETLAHLKLGAEAVSDQELETFQGD